ncbi:hypothetical protein SAY87_001080 [Trapa incisa]|uniref:GATA-type domain-containing protein n=1 Tax=Trapa incisa TaxID=236973 RepID=A0AAN7JGP4_9MYRT|nr:hypothetical protein SAY87_001080 [Trapa incisa]
MFGQKILDDAADYGSFFEDIDDILNFPIEDDLPLAGIWSMNQQPEPIPCSNKDFTGNNSSSDIPELFVQYEDIVPLDWLSAFADVDDSSSINKLESPITDIKETRNTWHVLGSSSPISVLDSSSSCSGSSPKQHHQWSPESSRCGRPRTKRPRPAAFSPRPPIQILPPSIESSNASLSALTSAESDNIAESRPVKPAKKKAKAAAADHHLPVRKCLHCEITKTPQWRCGPMGPKTLCNACGVRYKSGRLFPEYRPAASPTFVPSIHSNSHKKVIEMRSKVEGSCHHESMSLVPLIPNAAALDCSI